MADIAISKAAPLTRKRGTLRRAWRRYPTAMLGAVILALMLAVAIAAPLLTGYDPVAIDTAQRIRPPSAAHWFGTDAVGRDVFARTLYGARVSLAVGLAVAAFTTLIGLAIGLLSGYLRAADAVIMRVMDGLMAIPGVLLAIAIMALTKAGIGTVIFAITVAEIPRMVRVVRGVVLTIREQTYVEACIASGTRLHRILWRHILPNALAPVIVQATFVFASAVIIEAYLSFLGAGIPPEIPSWGNIMAEGRSLVLIAIWLILFPGLCLGLMVFSINLVGDGLRDALDPRAIRRA
jgi:peptide/nickel transport system permease protein